MHPEALTSELKKLWPRVKNFKDFTLVGGTALALQIGHRVSVDFDFFTKKELPTSLPQRIRRTFKGFPVKIVLRSKNQINASVGGVTITFFSYPFSVFQRRLVWEAVKILPISTIAVMKAYALGRRATYKDYIDLYFILREKHTSLPAITKTAKRIYGDEFGARLFLEQLVYLKDVREVPIRFLKKSVTKTEIETFFHKEVGKMQSQGPPKKKGGR